MIGAIEAGGTKFVCALARPDGTIVAQAQLATRTPAETFAKVRGFFEQAANAHGAITGFGVGSFGPLDLDPASGAFGTFTTTPKPGWSDARWADALGSFEAPLLLDSDVNAAALGEALQGAGRGLRIVAYTTVGTGIGSGIVAEQRPLRGFTHYEAGHVPIARDPADPFAGSCPFHGGGCVEGLASGTAIHGRWGRDLSELADEPRGIELIAGYLAQLAATLVLTHMPERLVFGGGVMKTPGLLDALRARTKALLGGYVSSPRLTGDLSDYIVSPELGDDAGIVGAVALGMRAANPAA